MSLLEKSSSVEISRRTQPFYAKKQAYGLGQQVQIEVDVQREFLDFENSRLLFELEVVDNGDGGNAFAQVSLVPWIASQCIKNLRVKTLAGQMIGHEIREYRAWCQMYKELTSNNELNLSYADVLEGAQAFAVGDDATTSIQLAHRFMSHLFTVKEYYPAHFHQGIMIEFDLPSAADLELTFSDAASPTAPTKINFNSMKYVCDLVQLKPEIENEMVKMMEEQKLFVDYTEVLTQENTISAGTGLKAYDVIGVDGRVKSIFQYTVIDSNKTAGNSGDSLFETYGRHGLGSYRFKLGANYLNYESINTTPPTAGNKSAEQCYELMKALDFHDMKSWKTTSGDALLVRAVLDGSQAAGSRFVTAVKVDKAQKNTDNVISSMIDKDRNNIRVELTYAANPTAGTSYTHIVLDKRIQILPGSIIRSVRS